MIEYLIIPLTNDMNYLNQLGSDGWELSLQAGGFFYLKRDKPEPEVKRANQPRTKRAAKRGG